MGEGLGRDFWFYRCAQIATALGYSASSIAVVWWILGEYQKMIYVSYLIVPPLIVSALAQPLIAPAGDRYNKKLLILSGLALQFLSYITVAFVFMSGGMKLSLLVALELLSASGRILFNAGSIGILPHLIPENRSIDGMNITHRVTSTMSIIGGVSGGAMVTLFGVANSFLFLACCITLACVFCISMRCHSQDSQRAGHRTRWLDDVREGFNYTTNNKVISGFFIYSLIISLALAPMMVAFPYVFKEIKGLSPLYVGLLATCMGVGMITGSFIFPHLRSRFDNKSLVYVSSSLFFLSLLLISLCHHVIVLFIGQFIIGLSRNWINVVIDSLLLINLPKHLRTRVLSNLSFFAMINMPVAMLLFSYLMDLLGVYNIFLMLSVLCFIAMLVIVSNREIRRFLSAEPQEAAEMLMSK
ncbi:MFS transporter [Edwardsiella tarda]|uniref:MFS transporter n=1 Tax=Edwardsiella tarda TaxID=636 RepID=UPI00083B3A94|nr:MFS transporter [Edwardsiella tarda]